jgi:hypothetical protein
MELKKPEMIACSDLKLITVFFQTQISATKNLDSGEADLKD